MKSLKTLKKLSILTLAFAAGIANAQNITVKNFAGEQNVPQNPQKVVVLDFGVADTLRALGEKDKIVGFPKSGHIPSYLAEFAQDKFQNVGSLPEPAFEYRLAAPTKIIRETKRNRTGVLRSKRLCKLLPKFRRKC